MVEAVERGPELPPQAGRSELHRPIFANPFGDGDSEGYTLI